MPTSDSVIEAPIRHDSRVLLLIRKCCSFHVLMGALLVAGNAAIIFPVFRIEPDTWWHIKFGDEILSTGRWPVADAWSFTAHGFARVAYEWGGEVVLAIAYRLGRLQGLQTVLFALTGTITLLLFYYAYLGCRNSKAAFVASAVVLPLAAYSFTLRPQLLGYIFLLLTMISLERYRQGRQKSLWVLPAVFLIWVNTHSSFSLGFMFLGLYWLGGLRDFSWGGLHAVRWKPAQRLHLELVSLASLLVLPLTPYGTRLATVPVDVATSLPLNFANIIEWQPLNFSAWQPKLLLLVVLAFVLLLVALRPILRVEQLALCLFAIYAACTHSRFAILFALVVAPLLASFLSRCVPNYRPEVDKYLLNVALVLAAAFVTGRYFPSETELKDRVQRDYPLQAVEYLRQHPVAGPMFNDYGFGGYLVWSLPEHKVFIDGRGDFYEQVGVFSDYMSITNIRPEAATLLEAYHIRSCLIPEDAPLATLLAANPQWKRIYRDEMSAIFVRESRAGAGETPNIRLRQSAGSPQEENRPEVGRLEHP